MKNDKLFQICYSVNFFICLLIIIIRSYIIFIQSNSKPNNILSFIILLIIIVLFASFDWFCYKLSYSIRHDIPLSNKTINKGKNYKNICLFLSSIFCIGIIYEIKSLSYINSPFFDFKEYPLWYFFIFLFITTFYLSIVYGLLLKQHYISASKEIDEIGTGEE